MAPADPEVALIASGSEEEGGPPAVARRGFWGWRGLAVAGLSAAILGVSASVEGCGGGDTLTFEEDGTTVTFGWIPEEGGLITELKFGDTPILVDTPQPRGGAYGSTFWPAPKSSWPGTWPPPAEIATGTYDVNMTNDTVLLTSKPDEAAGIQVQKFFAADTAKKCLVLKYTITGLNETEVSYAGWETTYVPAGGLTFWKTGTPAAVHAAFGSPLTEEIGGITYVDHANANITDRGAKISMRSDGRWMARATNETVFVKVFQAVAESDIAPGEGNIAMFAMPGFASMETQGAYTATSINNPFTYVVCWYIKPLPDDALAVPGDEKLLAAVTAIAELGCPEE
eukprot:CAMPEP_0179261160 /NCGR_PEP_ID=MMETSP0797-20121207/26715_1 /TAXON_ID=47934 /ORGANISM="Dinophysis acuminata, Strain DAEP01" /LENGTH=340 /DNA_ID=CAMNT_0020969269 /DNA_START=69 /DNA_END=1091 /DNA_ORIENTATION=-